MLKLFSNVNAPMEYDDMKFKTAILIFVLLALLAVVVGFISPSKGSHFREAESPISVELINI